MYQETPESPERSYDLRVNHPLKVDGASVYLLGHGYAPRVTVRDGKGEVAFSGPAPFLPQDGNFSSFGVIKAPDARPEQLGFEGFFLPTATIDPQLGPISVFPDALDPALVMTGYYGRPADETGKPQSVYQLDKSKLTQFDNGKGDKLRFQLAPGDSIKLPDNRGSITFDSYDRWVKLQVSHTPGLNLALGGISLAILGLMGSLFIHPRRTWVRVRTVDGRTVVEVAGLDRGPERGLGDEIQAVAQALQDLGSKKPNHQAGRLDEAGAAMSPETYAQVSNLVIPTATVIYVLAMVSHAVEWATGRAKVITAAGRRAAGRSTGCFGLGRGAGRRSTAEPRSTGGEGCWTVLDG